jgi:hypothetical protein
MEATKSKPPETQGEPIDVKKAVKLATRYFIDLYSETRYADLSLEEVELSEDGGFWSITLGYNEPENLMEKARARQVSGPLAGLLSVNGPKRRYKLFKVDARSGRVISMRIRRVE